MQVALISRQLARLWKQSCLAILLLCCAASLAFAQQNAEGRLPVTQYSEPYLLLIRDPVIQKELKLTADQQRALQQWTDETDGPLLTTRNQTVEKATETNNRLMQTTRERMQTLLTPEQNERLSQVEMTVLGLRSLTKETVVRQLDLSSAQTQKIRDLLDQQQQTTEALQKQLQQGESLAALEKKHAESGRTTQKKILALLQARQQQSWRKLLGASIDVNTLGTVKFKAPELLGDGPWINSEPLTWEQLRGKVVVLHFWTFGCINCIHNYPAYHHWMEDFSGQDVVLLGIHTPEVKAEFNTDMLRQKIMENQLTYPVFVDNQLQNWNAWGNSMWPTVYLVDKQGKIRGWWMGELNWENLEGEKIFRRRIKDLLIEPAMPPGQ